MLKIALTGGIASGKSTVSQMFISLGAYVIDCDELARKVVKPNSLALAEIKKTFGPKILKNSGTLNRQLLREIIFNDRTARFRLNSIMHPKITALLKTTLKTLKKNKLHKIVIIDIPLLFELGWNKIYPLNIVVYSTPETCIKRLISRDNENEIKARTTLAAQMPLEYKQQQAYFVIDNTDSLEVTFNQVQSVWKKIT